MAKIGICLDGFKPILNLFENPIPAMNKLLAILEMERVSMLAVSLEQNQIGYSDQMIDFINKVSEKVINVYVELNPEKIHKGIQLQPKMLTLIGTTDQDGKRKSVHIQEFSDELKETISELKAHEIIAGINIEPEVAALKRIHKMGFEYIELNALHFSSAIDFNDEMNELHRLKEIANMATNLGMGVNVRGDIGEDNIKEIGQITSIEEVILEERFFKHAVFKGFSASVEDFYRLLND